MAARYRPATANEHGRSSFGQARGYRLARENAAAELWLDRPDGAVCPDARYGGRDPATTIQELTGDVASSVFVIEEGSGEGASLCGQRHAHNHRAQQSSENGFGEGFWCGGTRAGQR